MAITGATDLGNGKVAVTVDHDPTTTATNVPIGTLIIDAGGNYYRKLDNGSTTNVSSNIGTSGFSGISGFSGTGISGFSGTSGAGGGASLNAQFAGASSTDTTDTSLTTTYADITTMVTSALTGTFWIIFSVECGGSVPVSARLLEGGTTISETDGYAGGGVITQRWSLSGIVEVTLSGVSKTYKIQSKLDVGTGAGGARRGRIMFFKKPV
jgi:hypothetical protein